MKLNILGQDYKLLLKDNDKHLKFNAMNANGLAELYNKELLISTDCIEEDDMTFDNLVEYANKVVRHEIVHAYFHEAGLTNYCNDEILVDWLAHQIPKITKTFNEFYSKQDKFYNK